MAIDYLNLNGKLPYSLRIEETKTGTTANNVEIVSQVSSLRNDIQIRLLYHD